MKSFLRFLVFVLLLALATSLIFVWNTRRTSPQQQTRAEQFTPADKSRIDLSSVDLLQRLDEEFTKVTDAVVPSVVSITTTKVVARRQPVDPFELFFGRRFSGRNPFQQRVNSLGSGLIVSKEGHIVTNNHVVAETDEIAVQLSDSREAKAKIIGTDAAYDLAILKIDLPNLEPLALANSDQVRAGQIVFAIGNPFGLQESVSQGIISAKDRRAVNDSSVEFFQTDTAINPGNSGGPLVNIKGEVIGINTAIYSESGGNQGIGFAIPSNVVRKAMSDILSKGRVVRGYLGVAVQPVNQDLAEQFNLPGSGGALVTEVTPGSPAEKAGVVRGDVIIKLNNAEIRDAEALANRVSEAAVGSKLSLVIVRDGQTRELTGEVAEQPAEMLARLGRGRGPGGGPQTPPPTATFSGIQVRDLNPWLRREANVPENVNGVLVTQVEPGSPAAQALRPGDVIEEINRQPVNGVQEFQQSVSQLDEGRPIVVGICRNRQRSFAVLQAE
jgi:serine protease Do